MPLPRLKDIHDYDPSDAASITKARPVWIMELQRRGFSCVRRPVRDPRPENSDVRTIIRREFMVIPMNGVAYWFFETQDDKERFAQMYPEAKS